jgi:hypothetical protein
VTVIGLAFMGKMMKINDKDDGRPRNTREKQLKI